MYLCYSKPSFTTKLYVNNFSKLQCMYLYNKSVQYYTTNACLGDIEYYYKFFIIE